MTPNKMTPNNHRPQPDRQAASMIELDTVQKYYGSTPAIKGVSFQVDSNHIVGLLGPNGAGKTTLIRIICGYHFPTVGEVRINDYSVTEQPRQVKEQIGYLPENAPLYTDMAVIEYLHFMAAIRSISPKMRESRMEWVLSQCGLTEVSHQSIATLSKGYRQRVGLAQAILHDPPILILDEPTSGLDPNQIIEIRNLIAELGKKKTVILSTHILQEVEALCDTILILHQGQLVAQGSSVEIASQMKGEQQFSILLKSNSPAKEIKGSLLQLQVVQQVVELKKHPALTNAYDITLSVQAADGADPGEALFDWVVHQRHKILRLTTTRITLENIFAQLTATKE